MSQKNRIKASILITAIALVVILAIELGVLQIVDKKMGSDEVAMSVTRRMLEEMDKDSGSADEEPYSEILGRKLTADEEEYQRVLETQQKILIYNNMGLMQDFLLPDGTWFLDEDMICIRLSVDIGEERYINFFSVENEEIINRYRACWEDSFYSYDKNVKEMVERYRYYQLVFDSFYMDGMMIVPEQVSIYKVECMPPVGSDNDYSQVTGFELVDVLKYEVENVNGLDYYKLAGEINQNNVTGLSYDYTCNGAGGYSVLRDCTLNGKFFSVEARKSMLASCAAETYEFQDRDLLGLPKYHVEKETYSGAWMGGNVTAVVCDQNILYNAYKYTWQLILFVLLVDVAAAIGIAAIAMVIRKRKMSH